VALTLAPWTAGDLIVRGFATIALMKLAKVSMLDSDFLYCLLHAHRLVGSAMKVSGRGIVNAKLLPSMTLYDNGL
jgi:hypothetical protein